MGDDGRRWRDIVEGESGDPSPLPRPRLYALIIAKIADFTALRRAMGVSPSEMLAPGVAERIAAALPDAAVRPVSRTIIEVEAIVGSDSGLDEMVASIHRCVEHPFTVDNRSCHLRLSIGAAVGAAGGDELTRVEAAEAALDQAQPGGGHDGAMAASIRTGLGDAKIGRRLQRAIERGELFLQYQPKLHLRRQEITSVEALIRWRHPSGGLVLPNDFIPAAERSGAIRSLTMWTLRQVVTDQRLLRGDGRDLTVFVNIAGVLLSDAGFIDAATALVRESGVRIGFEITETSVIREPEAAIAHLQRLADIGVEITIDDYGAGLSSLAYLKQLPARELKIDKLFVTQLASSHRDPLIVRSTIDLAHALDMEVVAEGVETPTSLALLSVMGCDMVQGYLISRPLMLEDLRVFLRDETHRDVLERSRSRLERLAAVQKRA